MASKMDGLQPSKGFDGEEAPVQKESRSDADSKSAPQGAVDIPDNLVPEGPWSIGRRNELLDYHPVVRRQYTVPTPMLVKAHQEARDRVWSRRTGAIFYGETRTGKSTCAVSIRDYLQDEFKNIYITMASGRSTLRPKRGAHATFDSGRNRQGCRS